jgi:hypothetical protein
MNRPMLVALGLTVAIASMLVAIASGQDGCPGAMEGVDLAVQNARVRQRDDESVVLYTVVNRGHMTSTSYSVSLSVDGANVDSDQYDIGLEPGHRRRWELAIPQDIESPAGHELTVRVTTAGPGSAAGPSYTDQCALNDALPVTQFSPRGTAARGADVLPEAGVD